MKKLRKSLDDLEIPRDFIRRHIGPSQSDIDQMLAVTGHESLEQLIDLAVPASIVSERPLDLPPTRSERATSTYLRHMRHRNRVFVSMIGCGYHGTIMPPAVSYTHLTLPTKRIV